MTSSTTLPPENPLDFIYGTNPLLSTLGPRVGFDDWPTRLTNRPLKSYDLCQLNATAREEILILYKHDFVATTGGINIAAALQNLHREHYWQRHPRNPNVLRDRTIVAQIARQHNYQPESVPWFNTSASGIIIKGITGMGKTSITNRYTDLIVKQVHEHANGEIPGFDFVKQIVWLKVDMSSDGSRDGFLTSILLEIDRLVGSSYARQFAGKFSVDRLAIVVGVILSTHLCGLLIIEEIQEKNFNNSKWRNPLTTFFLRILNFGIPTVLIGNPLGFTELEKSSQNVRRLSSGGVFEMDPAFDPANLDFTNLVQQTSLFNVMPHQSTRGREYFCEVAYKYSGGITDFVVRLNVESQLLALRSGTQEVLPEHIDKAFVSSQRITPNHVLINGLVNRDRDEISKCNDIPVEHFVDVWRKEQNRKMAQANTPGPMLTQRSSESSKLAPARNKSIPRTETGTATIKPGSTAQTIPDALPMAMQDHPVLKQFKSEQTRELNKRTKAMHTRKGLAIDDIRGQGASASLATGLTDLLKSRKER